MRLEPLVRALLVRAHQPRVAGDIDRQNGRQSSLDPSFAHLARQSTGRSEAEDMTELSLTRAPLRGRSGAEPGDGSPPTAADFCAGQDGPPSTLFGHSDPAQRLHLMNVRSEWLYF